MQRSDLLVGPGIHVFTFRTVPQKDPNDLHMSPYRRVATLLQQSAVILVPTPDFPYLRSVRDEPKQLLRAHNPGPDVMYFIHH